MRTRQWKPVVLLLALLSQPARATDAVGSDDPEPPVGLNDAVTRLVPLVIQGRRDPLYAPERRIERLMRSAPCLGCEPDTLKARDSWGQRAAESAFRLLDRNLLPQAVPERSAADDPGDDTLYWIQRQDAADRLNRVKAEP